MVYTQSFAQPSLFELARAGNFQAISYWINKELKPQGISASVAKEPTGRLQVLVEFQNEPPADRLIKFICHQLWQLNSPMLEGVSIIGRFSGSPKIEWKKCVKIVSPAKRNLQKQSSFSRNNESIQFQTFRSLMLIGSAVAAFILGCWVSYHQVLLRGSNSGEWVQGALEKVQVVNHRKVAYPNDPIVTLMFGGDVNLSNSVSNVIKNNYDWVFAKMEEYRKADLAMVNLENPLTRSTLNITNNQQQSINIDPRYVKVLKSGGIDLVNLANDHFMDYKQPILAETIETLDRAGIHSVGAGITDAEKEVRKPDIIEVKGQKIAYLSYYDTDLQTTDNTKEIQVINAPNNDQIAGDIQALRNQVDWIIVNYHWGVELSEYPGDWQMDVARFTIDQGADLVVGHHPKVLQGAEIYQGRPIIYSLGNFIFGDNSTNDSDYDTAVLKVSLKQGKMKIEFLPVVVKKYQPQVVEGEKGKEILKHIAQISSAFNQPMKSSVEIDVRNSSFRFLNIDSQIGKPNSTPSIPSLPDLHQKSPENDVDMPKISKNNSDSEVLPQTNSSDRRPFPPRLNPTTPYPKEAKDPFIQEPFIKEPFIELPRLPI
ncbi:MAG: CapA family protein [Microcoleaceae cyanobacterium MO_207.B10]|nr:CapA family protein [Microcoleaceae cyanobacterium MO_207.B10]